MITTYLKIASSSAVVEAETNKIQNIDSAFPLIAGAGYKAIKTSETSFDLFTGLGYSKTEFGHVPHLQPAKKVWNSCLVRNRPINSARPLASKQRWVIYPGT